MLTFLRKNLVRLITFLVLGILFALAANGMEPQDLVITLLRGLAVGSLTFLVASGFSLIFGLLDVLNLAHGTLFMIGAYVGWSVFVRPDTFIDLLTPIALALSGFTLSGIWAVLAARLPAKRGMRLLGGLGVLIGVVAAGLILMRYPVSTWDVNNFAQSPVTFGFMADQGMRLPPPMVGWNRISPWVAIPGLLLSSLLTAFSLSLLVRRQALPSRLTWRSFAGAAALIAVGLLALGFNQALTDSLNTMNSNWLFLISVLVAVLSGAGLGAMMETTLIRPLYVRPIYQLMLTLGLSAVGIEVVRAIWGRPEITMPKPELFASNAAGCPATSLSGWWTNHCSTILYLDGRIRVYNEILIPLIGVLVLVGVWILLQRSRLGMIIRAGVQDREMVEALGINVRRVFTLVFALGVGLASLGGILAAPSIGLSTGMGETFFLNALIALSIGGLTSYPGAALGSLLVGLLEQFIIKYGQIGIPIPFTEIIFKPTPPLVPASTVLLMVIILLLMPNGLLGKKE